MALRFSGLLRVLLCRRGLKLGVKDAKHIDREPTVFRNRRGRRPQLPATEAFVARDPTSFTVGRGEVQRFRVFRRGWTISSPFCHHEGTEWGAVRFGRVAPPYSLSG